MRTLRMETQRCNKYRRRSVRYRRSAVSRKYHGYRNDVYSRFIMHAARLLAVCMIIVPVIAIAINMEAMGNDKDAPYDYNAFLYSTAVHTTIAISNGINAMEDQIIDPFNGSATIAVKDIRDEITPASSMEFTNDTIDDTPVVELDALTVVMNNIGSDIISTDKGTLRRHDLPSVYYPGVDFSSFQPYMNYRCVTNKNSAAYWVVHSENSYNDEYGMRRYRTTEDQFTINGEDDYMIALGTFYKEKGTAGSRYLIITSTGMYTAITGDEKSDNDTDSKHMFSLHQDGTCAGIIEWLVDQPNLERTMRRAGTITAGPIEPLRGEILQIYSIE